MLEDIKVMVQNRLFHNKTVKEVYESRWVWYHTILVFEMFLVIIILLLILFKI
jgi:hypothetical protein